MLYDWDCCCILKMHPVRSYAKAALEIILSEYIEKGFLRIMECAVEEAKSLINDERISRVHMTGGKGTHDAIVWGDLQGESRLTPKLNKPMTSELGCITPYIVASGAEWTAKQLQYQAQILVGPAIANSGCNCLSPKLVILDKDWPQYDAFIGAIKKVMDEAILLPAYYPGAGQRYDTFRSEYENEADATVSLLGGNGKNETKAKAQGGHTAANATIRQYMLIEIDDNTKNKAYALRNEPFAPILTVFSIRGGNDASEFLDKAVSFANESVFGTLSTSLILHPKVDKAVGDLAVARLRYGTIVVNGWSALAFNNYWGGHPSEELADIQSGKGFVNQTLDVDFNLVEKSVTRLPFKTILHEVQKPRDFRFQNPKFSKNLLHFMVKPKLSTFAPLLFYR
uniref:Aldehyde dehydrogenase domain-containing protein n=1 Tax=Aplanochytrium stocchinoi TaxID=215587 RepID=A0A7S3LMV7_9STRA